MVLREANWQIYSLSERNVGRFFCSTLKLSESITLLDVCSRGMTKIGKIIILGGILCGCLWHIGGQYDHGSGSFSSF